MQSSKSSFGIRRRIDIPTKRVVKRAIVEKSLHFPQFPNALPNPVIITDINQEIIYVNPAWEKLTGYTFDEVKGKTPTILHSNKTPKRVYEALGHVLSNGGHFETDEIVDKKKNGTEYAIYSTFFPIKEENTILFYAQIQRDITQQKRVEQELRFYQIILENMAEGVCITRVKDEKILYANPKFDKMFGYKKGEIVGKPARMLTYSKDKAKAEKIANNIIAKLKKNGEATYEILNVKKDGTPFWCRATASEFMHPRYGKVWIIVRENISKEKKLMEDLQKSEIQFHQLVEQAADGIFIADLKGRYTSVNTAGAKMLGYTPSELVGKTIADLLPQEDVKRLWESRKELLVGKTEVSEWKLKKKDGTFMSTEISAKILPGGRWQGIVRDISDRKEVDEQKNAFIGVASHELKTPITTLSAYAQVLQARLVKQNDKKNIYLIDNVLNQTKRLTALISDLLNVSMIESGKLELHKMPFDLNHLVQKVIKDFAYTTQTHVFEKKGTITSAVFADTHRIEEVLNNLLTNAIKYSPEGKKVIIYLSQEKNYAQIGIQDFGIGIKKEDQTKIFEQFFRTEEKAAMHISGFGLGLAIVKQIIERHNGRIWVESSPGKGSTFYFTLPLAKQ